MEATKITNFRIKLLDFCSSRTVDVEAIVEKNVNGRHNIVFSRQFCQEQNIIFILNIKKSHGKT